MPTFAELHELVRLSEATIDSQFQFWLTVTFATIVATFAARNLLSRKLRLIVSALYLLSTVFFASCWYYAALDLFEYQRMLEELGFDTYTPFATIFTRLVLVLFGSAVTIYFVHFGASLAEAEHGQD